MSLPDRRAEALSDVAGAGRAEPARASALAAAQAIESANRRAEALSAVASALAQAGHPEPALEAARAIEYADRRAETLSEWRRP